jgi:hypothetical protein
MRDVVLLVARMVGSHTGEYVSELMDLTVSTFEAENRVFAAVTDNGKNFAKGVRINQHVQDNLRCVCHTLQLALKDAIKTQPAMVQLFTDAQDLVVSIRRSSLLGEALADIQSSQSAASSLLSLDDSVVSADEFTKPLKLAHHVSTRFNSMCIVFSRLLHNKGAIQRLCQTHSIDVGGKALTVEQWEQMNELVNILNPVKEVCDALEASSTPSLSLLIPLIMNVLQHLSEVNATLKLAASRKVCRAVRDSVYERMTASLIDTSSQVAMMLDPRVRTKLIPSYNKATAIAALRKAFLEFPSTFASFRGAKAPPLRHTEIAGESKEEKEEPAAKRQKSVLHLDDEAMNAEAITEMDLFVKEPGIALDACPLEWWKQRATIYPVLSQMARVHLAVPASSAPSERVFSAASLVLDERRRRLDEHRVSRLVFMKRNMPLFEALSKAQ